MMKCALCNPGERERERCHLLHDGESTPEPLHGRVDAQQVELEAVVQRQVLRHLVRQTDYTEQLRLLLHSTRGLEESLCKEYTFNFALLSTNHRWHKIYL